MINSQILVLCALVAFAFADGHFGEVTISSVSRVPTVGGRVEIMGSGFFGWGELNFWIDGNVCADAVFHSDSSVACRVPMGTGIHDIVVYAETFDMENMTMTFDDAFAYQAPMVKNVERTDDTLEIWGRNFGMDAAAVTVTYTNQVTDVPYTCDSVVLADDGHLTCNGGDMTMPEKQNQQFFVTVTVNSNGVQSSDPDARGAHFSLGVCYDLAGVTTNRVNTALFRRAVEKSAARLKNLKAHLMNIRDTLPAYDDNTCCGSERFTYPVDANAMLTFAAETVRFQGCFDDRCVFSEDFLDLID